MDFFESNKRIKQLLSLNGFIFLISFIIVFVRLLFIYFNHTNNVFFNIFYTFLSIVVFFVLFLKTDIAKLDKLKTIANSIFVFIVITVIDYSVLQKTDSDTIYMLTMMILFILIFTIIVLDRIILPSSIDIPRVYLFLVIPLSVCYLALFAPWTHPDSHAHYIATNRFSNIITGHGNNEQWYARGEDVDFFYDIWETVIIPYSDNYKVLYDNFNVICPDKEYRLLSDEYEHMVFYSPINYLPQIIGMSIAKLLGLGTVLMLYLSRLCILVFYIVMTYRAVKITPIGKSIFAGIFLLPICLMMSSSFSYDGMVIISCFSFIANVLRLCTAPDNKHFLYETCFWAAIIGAVKGGGYLILLPISFFILQKNKDSIKKSIMIICFGVGSLLLFNVVMTLNVKLFQFGVEGGDSYSFSYAIYHPISFLKMCMETFIGDLDVLFFSTSGSYLSWFEFTIPYAIIGALLAIIFILSLREKDDFSLTNKHKIIMETVIIIGLISTPAMLLSFTTLDFSTIRGLQGRYFLPLLPLAYLLLSKFSLHHQYSSFASSDDYGTKKLINSYVVFSAIAVYYMIRIYMTR